MRIIDRQEGARPSSHAHAAWTDVWHLWTVIVPRRSITGRLVVGQVWRRHDGRHWIYKKFGEYAEGGRD